MGLRSVFQRAAQKGLAALIDIAHTDITYHHTGTFEWSEELLAVVETGGVDYLMGPTIIDEPRADEITDSPVVITDSKLYVAYLELPITLSTLDYVMIDLVRWNVKWFRSDAAQAIHKIFVRKA